MGELLALALIGVFVLAGVYVLGALASLVVYAIAGLALVVAIPAWAAWTVISGLVRRLR